MSAKTPQAVVDALEKLDEEDRGKDPFFGVRTVYLSGLLVNNGRHVVSSGGYALY